MLGACSTAPKKSTGQSGSFCFRFIGQNQVQEFIKHKNECLHHRSVDGTTPLMLASAHGHLEILQTLIQESVDVNEVDHQGDTALNYAVSRNQIQVARLLLKSGAKVKSQRVDGITSLMQAVQYGSYEMIQVLLQDQEAINDSAEDGWTALYFSLRRKKIEILNVLLQNGACPNVFDAYQQTAKEFVNEVNWPEGLNLLLKARPC